VLCDRSDILFNCRVPYLSTTLSVSFRVLPFTKNRKLLLQFLGAVFLAQPRVYGTKLPLLAVKELEAGCHTCRIELEIMVCHLEKINLENKNPKTYAHSVPKYSLPPIKVNVKLRGQ